MKIKNVLPKVGAMMVLLLALVACNEDFESLGTEIIDGQGLNVTLDDQSSIVGYSRKLPPVQTNALGKYQIGTYNDPTYGISEYNLLTQLNLDETNPDFGENPVIDSVYVYIPYFSTAGEVTDEVTEYTLDSVYGESPIKLELFESNFFLRSLDPTTNFEDVQLYFNDNRTRFENFLVQPPLLTIDEFTPDATEIRLDEGEGDDLETTRLAPGIRMPLSIEFFQERIFDREGDAVLVSNSNFRDYFRGIYFQVTGLTDDGVLAGLDLVDANITIYYTRDNTSSTAEDGDRLNDTLELNFTGISVNTIDTDYPQDINDAITNTDQANGEDNLYLQGANVMSVIELFGDEDSIGYNDNGIVNQPNGTPDELDEIRRKGWLINEANLIFYVDQTKVVGGENEPERLTIFDIDNNQRLADYELDPTRANTPVVDAAIFHLERLTRDSDENGDFYTVRITNHITNLVQRDSSNVRLGVMVSQNVIPGEFQELRSVVSPGVLSVPVGSAQSHEGTVLYGNTSPNEDRRLKLQIFYTDPNQ